MTVICEECQKVFKNERGLRTHRQKKHTKKPLESTIKKQTAEEPKTVVPVALTSDEQAIAERAAKQDTGWMAIREDELNDFSLMTNPLDLMPEARKEVDEKRFAFRWCERTSNRIDQLTRAAQPPLRWAICTRTTTPFLKSYVDDLLGCIVTLDQVLLYKPWHHFQLVQNAKAELADIQDASGTLAGKKREIEDKDDDVEVFADEGIKPRHAKFGVKGSDQVLVDEAVADKELGIVDDTSDMGDLVVAE